MEIYCYYFVTKEVHFFVRYREIHHKLVAKKVHFFAQHREIHHKLFPISKIICIKDVDDKEKGEY
jgi:hypothetical protein